MAGSLGVLLPPGTSGVERLQNKIADLEARITRLESAKPTIPTEVVNPTVPAGEGRIVATDVTGVQRLWVVVNGTVRYVTLT
jgi:hypothetical protein